MARPQTEPGFESACKYNDRIIELTGVSGNNGRVGNLEKKVERLENAALKIMASACLGGGLVAVLTKLITG